MLSLLQDTVPMVTVLHHSEQLVDTFRQVHTKVGLVHCDLSLRKMFDVDGLLMLNDWGCVTQLDQMTHFQGAITHAPQRNLDAHRLDQQYRTEATDDLAMVWRCAAQSRFGSFPSLRGQRDAASIQEYWRHESTEMDTKMLSFPVGADVYELTKQCSAAMGPKGMVPKGMVPKGMVPKGMGPKGMVPKGMVPKGMVPKGMVPKG